MQAPKSRPWARMALAALFFAMAAGQLSDLSGFVDIVASHGIGGTTVGWLAATALIAGELTAAVGLVSRDQTRRYRAASVAVAVALAWGVLAAQAFARGIALENCGCFGVHAGQPLRWWVLIEDLEFLALAWWVRTKAALAAGSVTELRVRLVRATHPDVGPNVVGSAAPARRYPTPRSKNATASAAESSTARRSS